MSEHSLRILIWLFLHGVTIVFVCTHLTTADADATVVTAKLACMLSHPET